MANMGDNGNGATWVTGTTAIAFAITKIKIGKLQIDFNEVSTLATTDFEILIAQDLKKPPLVELEFVFSTSLTAPILGGTPETGTVTFPLRTGESAAATLAGTGMWKDFELPELGNNMVQTGKASFQYDGDTGPTYTKATLT